MAAEIKSLGERIDIRLTKIETRMDDWDMRFCNMEEKLTKCTESQQATEKLASCNSFKAFTSCLSYTRQNERRHEKKSFLHRIVTSDEKWIHFSNPTRQKSWGLPGQFPKQTPRPNRFGKKAMLCIWWDQTGVVYFELLKPGKTENENKQETHYLCQQSLFDRMKEVLKIPLEMDFDSYADADNDVVTNAMLSDVEIVESILQAKEEEETDQVDEEVDPIVHIPHPKEVLESIQTLRLFLQCQDESKSLHRHLSDLDNIEKSVQHLLLTSKCQKKITNYFSKNT
ncbi:SETMAR [Cordylochernes scorpioides]|uniref:SETMAR n=1 Tax=Cordylochernes scorpioides TaxID=51811 RepID=A0ABY6KMG0_9ARAC|nr:SETMAR [Cordylochernes scorpioides]